MAGDEVGVEMGEEDVLDSEVVLGGEGDVLVDVALGVDDGAFAGLFVADEVGGVGQAGEVELFEDHADSSSVEQTKKKRTVGDSIRPGKLGRSSAAPLHDLAEIIGRNTGLPRSHMGRSASACARAACRDYRLLLRLL